MSVLRVEEDADAVEKFSGLRFPGKKFQLTLGSFAVDLKYLEAVGKVGQAGGDWKFHHGKTLRIKRRIQAREQRRVVLFLRMNQKADLFAAQEDRFRRSSDFPAEIAGMGEPKFAGGGDGVSQGPEGAGLYEISLDAAEILLKSDPFFNGRNIDGFLCEGSICQEHARQECGKTHHSEGVEDDWKRRDTPTVKRSLERGSYGFEVRILRDLEFVATPICDGPVNPMSDVASHQKLRGELLCLVQEQLFEPGAALEAETDLFEAGMESMGIMQLILRLEGHYGIAVGDAEVTRRNFGSVTALAAMVERLRTPCQ